VQRYIFRLREDKNPKPQAKHYRDLTRRFASVRVRESLFVCETHRIGHGRRIKEI
jgi:hypothetical protein